MPVELEEQAVGGRVMQTNPKIVEAEGIEPSSRCPSEEASTCVVVGLSLALPSSQRQDRGRANLINLAHLGSDGP